MRRVQLCLPFAVLAGIGCGNGTPAVVTNSETAAIQEAAQKQADEEERNMKNGAYDPAAPKQPAKPRK